MKQTLKERTARMIASDPNVSRWHKNLNSDSAKRLYSEALCKYCEYRETIPKQIIEEFRLNRNTAENMLQDFILNLKDTYAPKVVHNNLVGVKSWLRHHGLEVKRKINVGNIRSTPTIEDEYPPSQEELRRILVYADIRGKAGIALIAFAGLRPSAIVALKIKDLPDMKIVGKKIVFKKMPARIKIRTGMSKNTKPYFTFLSSEGCEYLVEYFKWRNRGGEKLTPNSPVLTSSPKARLRTFSRKGFYKLVKRTLQKAEFPFRPYVLRSYFDTAIMNARGVPYDYQQFWMGHSGTIEATYTVNKRLPEWQIEEMRRIFKQLVEPRLITSKRLEEDQEIGTLRTMVESGVLDISKPNVRQYLIRKLGIEDATSKIAEMREEGLGESEAYVRVVCRELGIKPMKIEVANKNDEDPKKIVSEGELENYLVQGWDVQTVLPSGKILIRK